VARILLRREVKPEHFTSTAGGACYLTDKGRRVVLDAYERFRSEEIAHPLLERHVPRASLPIIQATLLARHLRGDLGAYPPFVMES
jgi:CRISPR-associated protein Cas1